MAELKYINLYTTDPSFNLAAEQYVFDSLPKEYDYFMLWQNDNAVIIGKYQNTLSEINSRYIKDNNVKVVRRLSGGGAVYHDMGNLNFTFITNAVSGSIDLKPFCEVIVNALSEIGIKADINGRNDITIDGKKFSGNSQYLREGRVMHHGTIMFASDLNKVENALNVDADKMESKGIKSVKSRVTSISEHLTQDVSLEDFRKILLDSILKNTPGEEYIFTPEDTEKIEKIKAERYDTFEWNYGKSPVCEIVRSQRIPLCGKVEAYISCNHSLIESVEFHGDFFSGSDPSILAEKLKGVPFTEDGLRSALEGANISSFIQNLTIDDLINILI